MVDQEMIERVARVLSPQSWQALGTKCDTKAKAKRREASLEYGKRAIEAMREPTKKMKTLVTDDIVITNNCYYCGGHIDGWKAMIDSILK